MKYLIFKLSSLQVKFSEQVSAEIYKIIVKIWDQILKNSNKGRAIELLDEVFNLQLTDSEDIRFTNAYEEINIKYNINKDWETDYLFIKRLRIYQDSLIFRRLIEVLLRPEFHKSDTQLLIISSLINSELEKDNLRLVIEDYDALASPIQKIYNKEEVDYLPIDIKKNNIPFYVRKNELTIYTEIKYFILNPDTGWNDYSIYSKFELFYVNDSHIISIGNVKIIHKEEQVTWDVLPDSFFYLTNSFCSLSGDQSYYISLRNLFGNLELKSILFALQDAALFTDISENYERNHNFRYSLVRKDNAERLLREIKPTLQGKELDNLYSFSYDFKPLYSKVAVNVKFDFNNKEWPSRIIALIGKNGVGKTQLLTALPKDIEESNFKAFNKKIPSFSKIIAISYSVFDSFEIPRKNSTFSYVYCGLKDENGVLRSNKGLVNSFHNNWKKVISLERTEKWKSILRNFIEDEIIDGFILKNKINKYEVSLEGFQAIKKKLSSGQSILLYIITQVIANIRFDSLILYDEPETHLHPNAVVALMNTIYELVEEFESYCLIATHSPLIIREMSSKNVFVMERNENTPTIHRIGIETFGENLGILTDEVFGDRSVSKHYKSIIKKLIDQGNTFEQIVAIIEFDEFPLSLNAQISIKNQIRFQNEKF